MARAALSCVIEDLSMCRRRKDRIKTHEFIILDVQEDEFWPEMSLLDSLDNLGDVDAGNEEFEVFQN
jgi:hypothetical protein